MSSHSRRGGAPGNDSFVEQLGDRLSADGSRKVVPLRAADTERPRPPAGPPQAQVPPSDAFPPPPADRGVPPLGPDELDEDPTYAGPGALDEPDTSQSDIHELPMADGPDDVLDSVPYVQHPEGTQDPFAQFEDDMEGESTRIDAQHLIAEQMTDILEESPDPPYLEVESGKDLGKEFVLNPGETTIGRSIDNDVILTDIAVSRRHLKIHLDDQGNLRLHDLGSGNGSQLNGRRIYDSPLTDGDRIELGETVLLVRIPSEMVVLEDGGQEPFERSTTDEEALPSLPPPPTAGLPGQPPGRMEATAFVGDSARLVSTDYIPSPRTTRSGAVIVPRRWLLVGIVGAGLLVALLGATVTALLVSSDPPPKVAGAPAAEDPEEALAQGIQAYEEGRWADAQRAFEQVLAAVPDSEEASSRLQQVRTVRAHARAIEQAREALEGEDPTAALRHLASVPADSPLAAQVTEAQRSATNLRATQLAREGLAALGEDDLDTARSRLDQARELSDDAESVPELAAEIEEHEERVEAEASEASAASDEPREARRQRPSRRTRRSARERRDPPARVERPSRRSRSTQSAGDRGEARALAAYRRGDFSGAVSAARSAADSASDSERRELLSLARRIEQFATAYGRAEAGRFAPSVARHMQVAIRLDRQIGGGHYAGRMRPHLVSAYIAEARQALGRGDTASGCASVRQALSIDGRNSAALGMSRTCEQRAQSLVRSAASLERSNPRRAREMYRQVVTMLPRGHALYTRAYQRLNQLGRRSGVDEDE